MSGPLAELADFSQRRDYDSLVGRHTEILDEIENLQTELDETLGPDSGLDDDQIERIRQTYIDVTQGDLDVLLEDDYELEAFCNTVKDIQDDIEEVLHNPKAETVVEEINSWIMSTGLDPLSTEEKAGLREIIISDVEACRTAISQAKTAHDSLRGDLGVLQEEVDQLLRGELVAVNAPSDLVEIREALQTLRSGWHGTWTLDHDLDIGSELNERVWTVMIEELRADAEARESLNKVAVLVDTRSERIGRALSRIDSAWSNVEKEYHRLSEDVSYDESKLLTLLKAQLHEDASLSTYVSAIETVRGGLETLREILDEGLDQFRSDHEPMIESLQGPVEDIRSALDDAIEVRSRALDADTVEEIEELEEQFDAWLEDADEGRRILRCRLKEKVKTVRRLAEKFDIETDEDLTDLYTSTVDQSNVDRLLDLSERCLTVHEAVRTQIRKELPEDQAQLFEDLLALSTDEADLTLTKIESELNNTSEETLVKTLRGLRENELLEIEISIS
jgi:hypothetical protein